MSNIPYLHPSQRNLRKEQVGPSSHQNEYHVGVLHGNWVEDRAAIGQKPVKVKMDTTTIARASYQRPPAGVKCRQDPISQGETDRQILFGHGTDFHQTNYTTLNELTYTDLSKGDATIKSDVAFKVSGNTERKSLVDKKKAQWQDDNDPEKDAYVSTKKATHDASGEVIRREKPPKATFLKPGEVSKFMNTDWKAADLRGGMDYRNTPLVKH
eukprot:Sspe_Gene.4618::Locus_1521_Transcript_1_1_Confidence_1.000_Length_838::g.4618::m.4618